MDKTLSKHRDGSDVTVNISLNDIFEGGEIIFYGNNND
jgi:hypothetical protein